MDEIFWCTVKKLFSQISSFNIDDEELKNLSCGICRLIMVDACQITACGCRFCRKCIEKYILNSGKQCPGEITNDCSSMVLRNFEDFHTDEYCNRKIIRLLVKCPVQDCGTELKLKELVDHYLKSHEDNITDSSPNCTEESEREDRFSKDNVQALSPSCTDESEIKNQSCEDKNEEKIENLQKFFLLKKKQKKLEKTIREMNDRIKSLEIDRHKDSLTIDSLLSVIDGLKSQFSESKYQPYVWIVNDFSHYRLEDVCLYSKSFFVFKGGYKMRLLMYPNGTYGDKDFVSVYFEIVRGEFDMLLKWPFCANVTLSVVPFDGGQRYSHTVFYLHHRSRNYVYGRPMDHANVGLGASQFIEYSRLSDLSGSMLYHDTLFLMCSVAEAPSSLAWVD